MALPSADRLLTVNEAAELLRVTDRTLRRWRRLGLVSAIKIGGVVRYRMADLERAMGVAPNAEISSEDNDFNEPR